VGSWLEVVAIVVLALTTLFSFAHEQYGTALVAGFCCGLVFGLEVGTRFARRAVRVEASDDNEGC
jgi:hypothetical protein